MNTEWAIEQLDDFIRATTVTLCSLAGRLDRLP